MVANDPDADRCAVAAVIDGEWRMLTGDELGALLADDALRSGRRGTYACSIVSSSLLATMAAAHRQPFTYTLTGFKWIGRVPGLAFGYEEAIGYCVDPEAVPDKDGITALLRVLALAAGLKASGHSLADRLDEIAYEYGVFATDQLSVRVADLSLITAAMARLRAARPRTLDGEGVEVTDLGAGTHEASPDRRRLDHRAVGEGGGAAVGNRAQTQVLPRGAGPPVHGHRPRRGPTGRASGPGPAQRRDVVAARPLTCRTPATLVASTPSSKAR